MENPLELILIAIGVGLVLLITYGLGNRLSRRRVRHDFDSPEEIVTAANIYLKYKQEDAALDILEHGLQKYPNSEILRQRLDELKASG